MNYTKYSNDDILVKSRHSRLSGVILPLNALIGTDSGQAGMTKFRQLSTFCEIVNVIYRVTIITLALTLTGCGLTRLFTTKLEKPTFTFTRFEVVETSQTQANVNFLFSAHNPNEVGLKNVFLSYELFVEDKKFTTGNIMDLDLPPKSDKEIKVPAVILYADLLPVVGSVAQRMLSGQKTIPLTINAAFTKKPTIYDKGGTEQSFSFETKLNKTVDFPLPINEMNKAINRLKDAIKNF